MSATPAGSILPLPGGFRASGLWAGIKQQGRGSDLGLLVADQALPAAAVFTRNALLGAHIPVCREHLESSGGLLRAILVNSGNANCATGTRGEEDARRSAAAVAEQLGCPVEQVLPISTGAIGARLPMDRLLEAIPELVATAEPDGVAAFARAIMTTDTHPKVETRLLETGTAGETARRVTGVAKGAGMIHPDMATMLGFVLTDAPLGDDPDSLCRALVRRSFHRISVDGDTSPNDTVVLWGGSDASNATAASAGLEGALVDVGAALCQQIAGDGEGATRLVTIEVRGAASEADAAHVGRLIATSPLVKTAIAGRDPNWGRILSTAGRADVPIAIDAARVWIGPATVFERGEPFPEREPEAWRHLNENHSVTLGIDLGVGDGVADVWTCDLTADYVRINADYRT